MRISEFGDQVFDARAVQIGPLDLVGLTVRPIHLAPCRVQGNAPGPAPRAEPGDQVFDPSAVEVGPLDPAGAMIRPVHLAPGHVQGDAVRIIEPLFDQVFELSAVEVSPLNLAGLVVFLLRRAGVHSGDAIAVGASGSFPGLLLAVFSAAKTMDLDPLVIASLGASQWGANRPKFHMMQMQSCLEENGILGFQPIAVSIGGDQDTGRDMQEEGRIRLMKDIQASGLAVLSEGDLEANVEARMTLYFQKASGNPIKAFVNIGGSWSNLGIDSAILHLKPGLEKITHFPPEERRGVLYAMAALDIPVIHLLFVKGLVQRYGLAWDPLSLPPPGDGDLYQRIQEKQKSFLYISILYLVFFGLFLGFGLKKPT